MVGGLTPAVVGGVGKEEEAFFHIFLLADKWDHLSI
jgi:hypothetical protein